MRTCVLYDSRTLKPSTDKTGKWRHDNIVIGRFNVISKSEIGNTLLVHRYSFIDNNII